MERLTSNKEVSDMSMIELAHNSCYADDKRNARYRDYDLDIDSRQLVRNLVKDICDEDLSGMSDEEFDEYMGEMLSVEMDSLVGLLALFYRNLWAMADLREKLKDYEDLEEQGLLLRLPCKVGDTVYAIGFNNNRPFVYEAIILSILLIGKEIVFNVKVDEFEINSQLENSMFGKTVFLTQAEAEAKLKELRGEENE